MRFLHKNKPLCFCQVYARSCGGSVRFRIFDIFMPMWYTVANKYLHKKSRIVRMRLFSVKILRGRYIVL